MRAWVLPLAVVVLVGCGGGDDEGGQPPPRESLGARLDVVVRAGGPESPASRSRVDCETLGAGSERCRRLGDLRPEALAPVPRDVACPSIYGGPAVARVTGTLRGKPIRARFQLDDGCEIKRWRRNRELLGPPP